MMGRLIGRLLIRDTGSPTAASRSRALALRGVAGCSALVLLGVGAYTGLRQPGPPGSGSAPPPAAATGNAASFRQIILPDLLVVAPAGLTSQQLTALDKIAGVRNMIAFDGAEIKAGNRPVSVIGVNPSQFRPWVPLQTASDRRFWTALASGQFVASPSARTSLGLRRGASYQLTGSTSQAVTFGAAASLGIGGVDLLVNTQLSRELGLVHRVAALISAPGASLATLTAKVRAVIGPSGKIVSLRQQQLPAAPAALRPGGVVRPAAHDLPAAVPGIRRPVLPGAVLDGARRDRPDRERGRHEHGPVQRRRARADAVPAVHLGGLGHRRVRPDRAAGHHEPL